MNVLSNDPGPIDAVFNFGDKICLVMSERADDEQSDQGTMVDYLYQISIIPVEIEIHPILPDKSLVEEKTPGMEDPDRTQPAKPKKSSPKTSSKT